MKREVDNMTNYNVAIIETNEQGIRTLISRSIENVEFVEHLGATSPMADCIIKVWQVGDIASEAVYENQGWL